MTYVIRVQCERTCLGFELGKQSGTLRWELGVTKLPGSISGQVMSENELPVLSRTQSINYSNLRPNKNQFPEQNSSP